MTQLVEVKGLSKSFNLGRGAVLQAVDKVSFSIASGETLGLVGESGCGKSTLGRVLVRMYEASGGEFKFEGESVTGKISDKQRRAYARKAQMIFQDPYASLNPRMTVGDIIAEGPDIHGLWSRKERKAKVEGWLERVGLMSEHAYRFPHEFSGGQRQRIGLARALAVDPKFVVCDEPISALDVSIQAQVVTLLQDLQKELGLTYLFIAHGLSMVRYISDRMAVMYLGQIVELGPSDDVYGNPLHPYTQALVAANPIADPERERARKDELLAGELPSPINPPPGCRFVGRCPLASAECKKAKPELREIKPGRFAACFKV
jgi:oligopeptide transport system ATP-binding protein